MRLQPLDTDQFWAVEIHWTEPVASKQILEDGCDHDGSAHLYHILARYRAKAYQSLYIGHTYMQCVSDRLSQSDHKHRYAAFVQHYPRHAFWVSYGLGTITNGRRTRKCVQDIE